MPMSNNPAQKMHILQFGEGNFLRGFIDLALQNLHNTGLFDGQLTVVSPIDSDFIIDKLNAQKGRYTVSLAGKVNGVDTKSLTDVNIIKNAYNAVKNWNDVLKIAINPSTRVFFSNTTEAGIVYEEEDCPDGLTKCLTEDLIEDLIGRLAGKSATIATSTSAPKTFPAKITALLFARFNNLQALDLQNFDTDLIIVPCELIEKGGEKLFEHIIHYAYDWQLGDEFIEFVKSHCIFYNTLVDRIVPGYPKDEASQITTQTGWNDELIVKAEPFGFFGLERSSGNDIKVDNPFEDLLHFSKSGLDVEYTNNLLPYRERKVHLLNAPHTCMSMLGIPNGIETVLQMITQEPYATKIRTLMFDEIIPMLDLPSSELESFANSVIDRFCNPFNEHKLESIALNEQSKFEVRVLPIINRYIAKNQSVPQVLSEVAQIAKAKWGIGINN